MNKDVQDSIRYGLQGLRAETPAISFTVRGLPQGKARARTFTAPNGVAYYDDKQVCHLTVKKWYTEEEPKVQIYIEEL